MIFGSHDAESPYYRNFLCATANGANWLLGVYNDAYFGSCAANTRYVIEACTIQNNIKCIINGVDQGLSQDTAPTAQRSALDNYIFAINSPGYGTRQAAMRLYSFKVYLDAAKATLIRDFIPCKNASGAVGLWDDVGSQFYGNAGTGAFTAGPEGLGSHKVMVGGTIYDVTAGQCMVGGTVYAIQKGLTMIGGTVYEIPLTVPVQGTPVGNLPVGTIVKTPVNGTAKEFIVVHQGLPSSLYDASCSGTWLLMKDIYENRQWHSSNSNAYAASTIHSYLNGTFLNLFDAGIKAQIKQVKIPYAYDGTSSTVASGANGLSAKIFLLGGYEVGWTTSDSIYFPVDGAKLSYFDAGTGTTANNKRVAYLNGTATGWWLRSPHSGTSFGWIVLASGSDSGSYASASFGIRPAFILPSDTLVDENMNLLA